MSYTILITHIGNYVTSSHTVTALKCGELFPLIFSAGSHNSPRYTRQHACTGGPEKRIGEAKKWGGLPRKPCRSNRNINNVSHLWKKWGTPCPSSPPHYIPAQQGFQWRALGVNTAQN